MAYWIADTDYPNGELFAKYPQQIPIQRMKSKIRADAKRVAPDLASLYNERDMEYGVSLWIKRQSDQLNHLGYVIVVDKSPDGTRRKFIIANDQFKSDYYADKMAKHQVADSARRLDLARKREVWKDAEDALNSIQ